jgi:hypothetical protein
VASRPKDKRRGQTRVEKVIRAHSHPRDARWYKADDKTCHTLLFDSLERLHRLTNWRRTQDLYCACLYDDAEFASLVQGSQAVGEFTPQTMTTNIVKRQVDTFVQRITEGRPIPMAITSGGTYPEQRRAKSLSKVFDGVLDQVGYWDTRPLLRRDGALFGDGFALNHRVGRQLFHDRAFPWEFYVDPREARYGKPQTLILLRYVDKLVMAERHPDFAEAIFESQGKSSWQHHWDTGWDEECDLVLVAWAWRLPSAEPTEKDAKSGAFALCVSEATIELSEYRRDTFPVSKWRFNPGLVGWRGEGMAWGMRGLQYEVNAVGLRLQEQGYLAGSYVWTPPDSGLETEHIDNGSFTHLVSTVKPEFFNAPPFHPGFFDWYMNLRGRFPAEESRLSEMATRGELPPGLESGKAIRSWNQLDDKAFALQTKEDERDAIDTAWQFFDLLEEIHDEGQSKKDAREPYVVKVEKREYGASILEEYKYEDYRLDKEKFTLRVFPTSILSGTPAEKYQAAKELMADGLVSQDEAYALIDIPDVQRIINLRGAARRAIEKILEKILDADDPASVYVHPEPAMNLELCRSLALMTYLDAWTNEANEENLKWVLQFALDAELEMQAAKDQAAAEEAAAMAGAAPINPAEALDPAMAAEAAGLPPEGMPPEALYAPPPEQPLPPGALPPEAMAPVPGM